MGVGSTKIEGCGGIEIGIKYKWTRIAKEPSVVEGAVNR
jgi:hypothetical protein